MDKSVLLFGAVTIVFFDNSGHPIASMIPPDALSSCM